MSVALVLFVVSAVLWALLKWMAFQRRFNEFAKKVGGPRGLPVIGVFHRLFSMRDVLYKLPKLSGASESAFFWLLHKPMFYTRDPETIEKILTAPECINKSEIYDIIDQEVGSGILTSKSPIWNHHRKLMNACFSHKVLVSFVPIFNEKTDEFIEKLDALAGRGESDIWGLLQTLAIQTSYATSVGDDISRTMGKNSAFTTHINRFITTVFERSLDAVMRSDAAFHLSKSYKAYQDSKTTVKRFVENLLNKKLAEAEHKAKDIDNNNVVAEGDSVDIVKSECIFIDMVTDMLRKNLLSWQEVCNEAYVVVAAAFETSATTLFSLLTHLAMHPEYQSKLYDEVVSVFPKKEFDVSYEDLANLVYMDMVFDETLRFTPSVPLISREVTKDVDIGGGKWMPKGTIVIVDILNLHRCEAIWGPNAAKFDPDNFLPGNQGRRHPYAYIPFSKGPRNCIGWRYARMFLKVTLSKIIRNYRLSTSFPRDELRFVQHLSLRYDVMPKLEIHRR